jgi:hypothetical protein
MNADHQSMQAKPYACLIGSLMYAAIATCPDIMFIVLTLAQFMADPAIVHWTAARRVIHYLIGMHDYALTFGTDPGASLIGYTNTDWASQPHRHSITGWAYLYDRAAILWSLCKQTLLVLPSSEAEFIASSSACQELTWLCRLIAKLDNPSEAPTVVHCNNKGAITLTKSGAMNSHTKHIDIQYKYSIECTKLGWSDFVYCPTNKMVTDIFTKALPRAKIKYFAHLLDLRCDA